MKILALNGGGATCYGQTCILTLLEAAHRKPVHKIFDMICGVSGGAIVGGAMAMGTYSSFDIGRQFEERAKKIFKKRWWPLAGWLFTTKYKNSNLRDALGGFFGDALISDVRTRLMVHATSITPNVGSRHWKSWRDEHKLSDLVMASGAAPVFFRPVKIGDDWYIDGGVADNNPSVHGIAEAVALGHDEKDIKVFNIKPSIPVKLKPGAHRATSATSWAKMFPLVSVGATEQTSEYVAGRILGERYLEINLGIDSGLDGADTKDFARMDSMAKKAWNDNAEKIINFFGQG